MFSRYQHSSTQGEASPLQLSLFAACNQAIEHGILRHQWHGFVHKANFFGKTMAHEHCIDPLADVVGIEIPVPLVHQGSPNEVKGWAICDARLSSVENEAATTVEGVKPLGIRRTGRRSFGCPWMILDSGKLTC